MLTVEISDDEDPRSAVPRGNTERSNGPRISVPGASELSSTPICGHRVRGVEHARLDAETFVSRLFDKVIDVPMTTHTCMGDTWEKTAVQVGEVEEEPDLLTAAELDARSGTSFDACVLKRFLAANRVPQRLPVLCLTPSELQLQSYSDVTPVCIIRYRLTSQALEALSVWKRKVAGKQWPPCSPHLTANNVIHKIGCQRHNRRKHRGPSHQPYCCSGGCYSGIKYCKITEERENVRTQQDQQQQVLENSESELDRTVQDTEQVRQKRLRFLEKEVEQSKRPREDIYDNDNDEDSSRIVTFPGINRDNIASQ
ncbi:uncharacterized protein [Montipora foliosa]|uniref:uncharacterized protein isoform X3 n=1 Tax=Montipora foliosa TaxID=591990 RepID=UPI0035F1BFDA